MILVGYLNGSLHSVIDNFGMCNQCTILDDPGNDLDNQKCFNFTIKINKP
jgi:hypothetical protein